MRSSKVCGLQMNTFCRQYAKTVELRLGEHVAGCDIDPNMHTRSSQAKTSRTLWRQHDLELWWELHELWLKSSMSTAPQRERAAQTCMNAGIQSVYPFREWPVFVDVV